MTSREYLPRDADAALSLALTSAPVLVIDGARAVGKSTSAERLSASALYLPRDLPRLVDDIDSALAPLARPVLIDEWQLAGTDLLWAVKRIVDADPAPGSFILVGSVEPASYGPTYPLTGRATRVVMRPMTHAELAGRGGEPGILERLLSGQELAATAGGRPGFDMGTLTTSGFPLARTMGDSGSYLDAYAATVAQRAGDEGRDATRMLTTMRTLAALEAEAVPDTTIWATADITKVTWKAYEDLLSRTHIAVPMPSFSSNRLKRLTRYPKRFTADVALASRLAGVEADALRSDPALAGHYLESFVMQQLRPQVDRLGATLSHLRTASGDREVDAIIHVRDTLVAIEVKRSVRPGVREIKHMMWLRDQLDDRWTGGLLVHPGPDTYPLGDRIWAVAVDDLV